MIHAKTCFVAEGLTVDPGTSRASAYNLLEELDAPGYPLVLQRLAFLCLWERADADPKQCRAEFSITLDGDDLVRRSIDIDFGAFQNNRCTVRLDGFTLSKPGAIVFRLAIPEHGAAEWTVNAGLTAATADATSDAFSTSRNLWQSETVTKSFSLSSFHRR